MMCLEKVSEIKVSICYAGVFVQSLNNETTTKRFHVWR